MTFEHSGRMFGALALIVLCSATLTPAAASEEALLDALRAGGFNIYFRHADTNWSQSDNVRTAGEWTSCDPTRFRQLSEEGRAKARRVGSAIRALGIPIGRVLASPYCRAVETARLMDVGEVEPTTDIINMRVAQYFGGRQAVVATARKRLAEIPEPGFNTLLVAHGNVARESTPVYPSEAEGIVFRPDGQGGFTVAGRLTPDRWEHLAELHGSP